MQSCFIILKLINIIHHIKQIMEKNHSVATIAKKKILGKNISVIEEKNPQKSRIKGIFSV